MKGKICFLADVQTIDITKRCYIKTRPKVRILMAPEEGWFGQPNVSAPSKKSYSVAWAVIASLIALIRRH